MDLKTSWHCLLPGTLALEQVPGCQGNEARPSTRSPAGRTPRLAAAHWRPQAPCTASELYRNSALVGGCRCALGWAVRPPWMQPRGLSWSRLDALANQSPTLGLHARILEHMRQRGPPSTSSAIPADRPCIFHFAGRHRRRSQPPRAALPGNKCTLLRGRSAPPVQPKAAGARWCIQPPSSPLPDLCAPPPAEAGRAPPAHARPTPSGRRATHGGRRLGPVLARRLCRRRMPPRDPPSRRSRAAGDLRALSSSWFGTQGGLSRARNRGAQRGARPGATRNQPSPVRPPRASARRSPASACLEGHRAGKLWAAQVAVPDSAKSARGAHRGAGVSRHGSRARRTRRRWPCSRAAPCAPSSTCMRFMLCTRCWYLAGCLLSMAGRMDCSFMRCMRMARSSHSRCSVRLGALKHEVALLAARRDPWLAPLRLAPAWLALRPPPAVGIEPTAWARRIVVLEIKIK